jgi:hypothetical protein
MDYLLGQALPIDTVVGGRDRAPSNSRYGGLGLVVESEGVGRGTAGAVGGQYPVALVIVEIGFAGAGATGSGPAGEPALVVVGHDRAGGRATRTGVPAGGVGVAAEQVAHRVIRGVLVGHIAQPGHRVRMVRVAVGVGAGRTSGNAIQAIIAVGLQIGRDPASAGRAHAVIAPGRGAGVTGPDHAVSAS